MLPFSHTVAILTCWEAKSLQTMLRNERIDVRVSDVWRTFVLHGPPVALSCYAVPHFGPKVLSGYGRWLRNKARDIPLPRLSRLSWSWFNMVQQTQWVFDHVHLYPHYIHVFFKQLSQVYIHWDQFCSIISQLVCPSLLITSTESVATQAAMNPSQKRAAVQQQAQSWCCLVTCLFND